MSKPLTRYLYLSICAVLILAAAVIRVRAAQNDLWLDEIWSLQFSRGEEHQDKRLHWFVFQSAPRLAK